MKLLTELRGIFRGSEGVDESLKRGHGGVDLENSGRHRLRRVLLPVDRSTPRPERAASFDVLEAHNSVVIRRIYPNFPEKIRGIFLRKGRNRRWWWRLPGSDLGIRA